MKIVIDIDEEVYNFIKDKGHIPYGVNLADTIINGDTTHIKNLYNTIDEMQKVIDEFNGEVD